MVGKQGIYAIVCSASWRSYVGSSVDLKEREIEHFRLLRGNKHDNSQLQKDFNEFGESCFHWEILELIEDDRILLEKEDYWIGFTENSYNTYRHTDIKLSDKDILRFWSCVKLKTPSECWDWVGAKDKDGYGRVGFITNKKKRMLRSNRIAYAIAYPEKWNKFMMVCHRCDNPSCCNPRHLFLDSGRGNAKDMANKGRCNTGKLNLTLANEIRAKYLEIGKQSAKHVKAWVKKEKNIDIHLVSINKILNNKSYYNEDWKIVKRKSAMSGEECGTAKLNWDIVNWLRQEYKSGKYQVKDMPKLLEEKYGITFSKLGQILRNYSWHDVNYIPPEKYSIVNNRKYSTDPITKIKTIKST